MPSDNHDEKSLNEPIVVPLDGSKLAEVALPYAEELGARTGSNIVLLSVFEFADIDEHKEYQAYLQRIISITRHHTKKYLLIPASKEVDVCSATRVGNPAEAIIDYACQSEQRLIVMATHGRSGIGRWAVGSVADKVVRAATNLPVLLIRGKKARSDVRQKRLLRKALVPLDGSISSQAVLPYIRQLALKLEMELTLFMVVQPTNHNQVDPESYLQARCADLEQQGIATNYKVRVGSPADEIINLADELAVDLVAMSTRGKTGFSLWTLGSVAQKVLLAGSTPLLLMRQK